MLTVADFKSTKKEIFDLIDVSTTSSDRIEEVNSLIQEVNNALMIEYDLGSKDEVEALADDTRLGFESKEAFQKLVQYNSK